MQGLHAGITYLVLLSQMPSLTYLFLEKNIQNEGGWWATHERSHTPKDEYLHDKTLKKANESIFHLERKTWRQCILPLSRLVKGLGSSLSQEISGQYLSPEIEARGGLHALCMEKAARRGRVKFLFPSGLSAIVLQNKNRQGA